MNLNSYRQSRTGPVSPEYLRVPDAVRLFGIGRSTLYALIANGSVASRIVKTSRHNVSGIRLISAESLRAFIENQDAAAPTKKLAEGA